MLAAGIWGEGSAIHSPLAIIIIINTIIIITLELSRDQFAQTHSTLYIRIGPQWLSELRRLWAIVP